MPPDDKDKLGDVNKGNISRGLGTGMDLVMNDVFDNRFGVNALDMKAQTDISKDKAARLNHPPKSDSEQLATELLNHTKNNPPGKKAPPSGHIYTGANRDRGVTGKLRSEELANQALLQGLQDEDLQRINSTLNRGRFNGT